MLCYFYEECTVSKCNEYRYIASYIEAYIFFHYCQKFVRATNQYAVLYLEDEICFPLKLLTLFCIILCTTHTTCM